HPHDLRALARFTCRSRPWARMRTSWRIGWRDRIAKICDHGKAASGDLLIGKITPRVRGPGITRDGLSAGTQAGAAAFPEAAGGATPLEQRQTIFQARHDRVGDVLPDFAELALADVAEAAVHGKLVGMDLAAEVDVGYPYPGAVTPPAVPGEHIENLLGAGVVLALHAQVEVRPIAMVIDRED